MEHAHWYLLSAFLFILAYMLIAINAGVRARKEAEQRNAAEAKVRSLEAQLEEAGEDDSKPAGESSPSPPAVKLKGAFGLCPQCGDLDVSRVRCEKCGYEVTGD
jgi:hypothetical protein